MFCFTGTSSSSASTPAAGLRRSTRLSKGGQSTSGETQSPPRQQDSPPREQQSPPRQQQSPPRQQQSPPRQRSPSPQPGPSGVAVASSRYIEEFSIQSFILC
jgi:hypothetical protein